MSLSGGTATQCKAGRLVRVARGTFESLSEDLVKVGPVTQLVIRVHFISQALGLEVDESFVEPAG